MDPYLGAYMDSYMDSEWVLGGSKGFTCTGWLARAAVSGWIARKKLLGLLAGIILKFVYTRATFLNFLWPPRDLGGI